jgi:CRP-like cAMP-binding protein
MDLGSSAEAFTELELEGDSLLHAVERAARLGAAARAKTSEPMRAAASAPPPPPAKEGPERVPEVPLFSDLPPQAFIELFERGPLLRFKRGRRVFEQGSVGRSFYIVCQGSVRILRKEREREREVAVLPEGSFFGEMALLSDSPRAASVEAAADETELLEISAALLSQLSKRHPSVAAALRKFCRQRLLLNVMSTCALFRPFDGKDRRALIERFRAREVLSSAVVIREGEHSDGLYVILSGEVQVTKEGRVLARLREGEIFGEMSLLDRAPASATVSAARRTSLLRLPREDFDELIMSHPQILVLVSELTDDRRRQTDAILAGTAAMGEQGLILV